MKVLQLVDKSMFLPQIVRAFSSFKDVQVKNVIILENISKEQSNEFATFDYAESTQIVYVGSESYRLLLAEPFDFVWVHYRTPEKEKFLFARKCKTTIVWSTWGGDYYSLIGNWLYGKRTTFVHLRSLQPISIVYDFLSFFLYLLHLNWLLWHSETRSFVKSISFFSTVVPEEEMLFRNYIISDAFPIRYNYLPKNEEETDYPVVTQKCRGIWVGNSATETNNHFDILYAIRNFQKYKITVPLSYGDVRLASKVAKYGGRLFGDRFCPIFDLLDYTKFVCAMAEHSIFIFGHIRQQAVGNIRIAIKLGGCVFLSKRNPVFHMLIREGFVVYPLEDLSRLEAISEKFFANHQHDNLEKAARWATRESLVKENCGTIQSLLDLSAKHRSSRL